MSHVLPLTAEEIERRLLNADLTVHSAIQDADNSNILQIRLDYQIVNGSEIKFKYPVDCAEITKLQIWFKDNTKQDISKEFAFVDANGNNVGDVDKLFAKDAVVKVILDQVTSEGDGVAFVQNAYTNKYLEDKFNTITTDIDTLATKAEIAGLASEQYVNNQIAAIPEVDLSGHYVTAGQISTEQLGQNATAEGLDTNACGDNSHAEGNNTVAQGDNSHAEGLGTIATADTQHVQGKYNVDDKDCRFAHIVGNGESNETRSNAHTLDWQGNAWFAGNVFANDSLGGNYVYCNSLIAHNDVINISSATVNLSSDTVNANNEIIAKGEVSSDVGFTSKGYMAAGRVQSSGDIVAVDENQDEVSLLELNSKVSALENSSTSRYSKEVLWQNTASTPATKFDNQTMDLSLAEYDATEIVYFANVQGSYVLKTTGPIPVLSFGYYVILDNFLSTIDAFCGSTIYIQDSSVITTGVFISPTGLQFSVGDKETNVPWIIYGIKH